MKMLFYITTVILALSTVASAADTTTKKPLCNSCVLVANAIKNANKLPNVKTGVKKICNTILKNDLTCTNVINAASLYLTLTPANTLCVEVNLCAATSLIPGLPTGLPIHLPTALPNIDLPIPSLSIPTAIPSVSDLTSGVVGALEKNPLTSGITNSLTNAIPSASGVVGALGKGLTNSGIGSIRKTRSSEFAFTDEQLQAVKVITDFINGQHH